jgi:1-phosphatidylinositol-3-phosphate 5-kinase
VTVVPPAEYQERFVNALERCVCHPITELLPSSYLVSDFLACPDKWSRPLDDVVVVGDPDNLPSVL